MKASYVIGVKGKRLEVVVIAKVDFFPTFFATFKASITKNTCKEFLGY